jgi:hypothetical protein
MEERRYTYYIYYTNDGEIYAYTDNKEYAKAFKQQRNPKKFYQKKIELTSEDLKELHNYYPESLLMEERFELGDKELILILAMMEHVTILNYSVQCTTVNMPVAAWVPPQIFQDDIVDVLKEIGYVNAYGCTKGVCKFTPKVSLISCFLYLYSNTINWKEGGIFEVLHVFSGG